MKIPTDGTTVEEHPLATLWIDNDGSLNKISKTIPLTPDNIKNLYSLIRRMTKGKKVFAIIEVSKESVSDIATREQFKKEIPKVFRAIAFLTSTPIGQMTGTLNSVLAPINIPTKVFKDEERARAWLKEQIRLG